MVKEFMKVFMALIIHKSNPVGMANIAHRA